MSYRVRIGKFPKNKYKKYKNKSYENLENAYGEDDGSGDLFYNFASPSEFIELEYISGIVYDDKDNWKSFYSFDLKKLRDYEFYILTKENLKNMIDQLSKEVYQIYNEAYQNFDNKRGQSSIASIIMAKRNDWSTEYYNHLDFKEDSQLLSNSGSLEYVVLNLVNIYKLFNWEDDYLIFSGW
jgi:hypothetical protein